VALSPPPIGSDVRGTRCAFSRVASAQRGGYADALPNLAPSRPLVLVPRAARYVVDENGLNEPFLSSCVKGPTGLAWDALTFSGCCSAWDRVLQSLDFLSCPSQTRAQLRRNARSFGHWSARASGFAIGVSPRTNPFLTSTGAKPGL